MSGDRRLVSAERKRMRAELGAQWAAEDRPCARCGRPIDYGQGWDLGDIVARAHGGDPLDRANQQPEHVRCNRAAGASMGNRMRGRRREAGVNGYRSTASRRLDRSRDW